MELFLSLIHILNMKFLPEFFKTETGMMKFENFLRAFVDLKIPHIQFNVVPVSYTHLDVYKRQLFQLLIIVFLLIQSLDMINY